MRKGLKDIAFVLLLFVLGTGLASAFQTEDADFPSRPDFSIEITPAGIVSVIATCNDAIQNQGEKSIDCEGPCSRKCGTDMIKYLAAGGIAALFIFSGIVLWKRNIFSRKPRTDIAADPKLAAYVQNAIIKGYSKEQIKKALLNAGWTEQRIDNALNVVK
jgi:hypothetical protein